MKRIVVEDRSFPAASVKFYWGCFEKLSKITGVAKLLLYYLVWEMNKDNIVHSFSYDRHTFRMYYAMLEISDSSVVGAYKILTDANLLIKIAHGTYMVNPVYFMNSANEGARERLIKKVLDVQRPHTATDSSNESGKHQGDDIYSSKQ